MVPLAMSSLVGHAGVSVVFVDVEISRFI